MEFMGNWTQFFALIGTLSAGLYVFYHMTEKRIDKIEQQMEQWRKEHNEDLKEHNKMWMVLFERFHILDKDMEKFRINKQSSEIACDNQ